MLLKTEKAIQHISENFSFKELFTILYFNFPTKVG